MQFLLGTPLAMADERHIVVLHLQPKHCMQHEQRVVEIIQNYII